MHGDVDAARLEGAFVIFELQDFDDVDGGEAATDDEGVVRSFVARAGVGLFVFVVVPVDEGILVHEAFADVRFGFGDAEFAIAPGAVGENDGGEAPLEELGEVEIAAEFGGRNEMDVGLFHARVDAGVFLFALFDVPAREAVFDFAVGALVLFEDGDANAGISENFRGYGTGNGATDDGYEMAWIRHGCATLQSGNEILHCGKSGSQVMGTQWIRKGGQAKNASARSVFSGCKK